MSAWVLPDYISDVLPAEARLIEAHRRALLDIAGSYGYELVMPPLVEHIESLLTGTGKALHMQTFKMVDLLSGRTIGVRSDTTQQVARIDAHLLNRPGVTRLCYCGPVLHTRPSQPGASREPLQFGAEMYGYEGIGAELESLALALDTLAAVDVPMEQGLVVDLAEASIVPALLAQAADRAVDANSIQDALITKNAEALREAAAALPEAVQEQLLALLGLYGGVDAVLERARAVLPPLPAITSALNDIAWLAQQLRRTHPQAEVLLDLADLRGYSYYSGIRFAIYLPGSPDALVRGGRYNEVGAVYGRNRPAVGFSMDVRAVSALTPAAAQPQAILAHWREDLDWRQAVRALRAQGRTVVVRFPGQSPDEGQEGMHCQSELVQQQGQWVEQPLTVQA